MTEPTADLLLEFVLGLLAPLFMVGSITDIHLARLTARQAIEAAVADGHGQVLTAAQAVAFALAALDNLRLSMAPDVSLAMRLKLRGNAASLSRAARHDSQRQDQARRSTRTATGSATTKTEPAEPDAETIRLQAAAERQAQLRWADAMTAVAAELGAKSEGTAPAQRKTNALWVNVLTDVANELAQARPLAARPGMNRARLLRTTLMATTPEFPIHAATRPVSRQS